MTFGLVACIVKKKEELKIEKIQKIETFRDIRGYYLKELENVKPNGIN